MIAEERHSRLIGYVRTHGIASVQELVDALATSEATVRRDLKTLSDRGLLRRTHGGAAFAQPFGQEPTFEEKAGVMIPAKRAIAAHATQLINDNDVIALGAGTTTLELASLLTHQLNLTVVTNSLLVADVLAQAPGVVVIISGGHMRRQTRALTGMLAEQGLSQLHVSTLFLSGNGLTAGRGLSTPALSAASVDRALAKIADRVVVLADSSKIGHETMTQTVAASDIDMVITDSGADPDELGRLRAAGVTIVTVDPRG